MKIETHHTDDAPAAIGPYSQSVSLGDLVFTSGQIALDPTTGEIIAGDFADQAKQVIRNLEAVLTSVGCTFEDVIKATIYVADLANFGILNELYAEAMGDHRPARSTVQAAGLPKGALVEIDFIARRPSTC